MLIINNFISSNKNSVSYYFRTLHKKQSQQVKYVTQRYTANSCRNHQLPCPILTTKFACFLLFSVLSKASYSYYFLKKDDSPLCNVKWIQETSSRVSTPVLSNGKRMSKQTVFITILHKISKASYLSSRP